MNLNFKKLVSRLVAVLILTLNINLSAQDITPGVISLSQSGNLIIIDFQLPEYSIENINIYDEYGINQYYANIDIDNFGQVFDVGYPELPQLTVDLHVPEDATTFNVSTSNIQTETKYLSYKIMPTQKDDDDEDSQFVIENSYYQSSGYSNQRITKKLFIDAYTERDRLGQITNLGMKRYYKSFWSWWGVGLNRRKRQMKRYNLLGAPSLYVRGTGCISDFVFSNNEVFYSGDTIVYHAENDIIAGGDTKFEIKSGSDVTLIAGNSIRLDKGFKAEAGASFRAYIEPCSSSMLKSGRVTNEKTNLSEQSGTIEKAETNNFVKIYPNPTKNKLIVEYTISNSEKVSLSVHDLSGKIVKNILTQKAQQNGTYQEYINISNLSVGTYVYTLLIGSEKHQGKILKIE